MQKKIWKTVSIVFLFNLIFPQEQILADYIVLPEQLYYDVNYYGLDLDVDVNTNSISGSTTISGTIISNNTSQIVLNFFDHMTVDSVTTSGQSLSFTHTNKVLTCNLPQSLNTGDIFSVTVYYSGFPGQSGVGDGLIFGSYNGSKLIYSYSWPYWANTFFPCKDHPSDKADSVQIAITVPDSFQVACNGVLESTNTIPGNQKQFVWKTHYAISPYHISINIYPFDVYQSSYNSAISGAIQLEYYMFPNHTGALQQQLETVVPKIHEAYESKYGPFPFSSEKSGYCESVISGGMEHQTILTMNYPAFFDDIVVHESAHEYFGNLISISDWGHIWLSEGFATYSEAIYKEYWQGPAAYLQEIRSNMSASGNGAIYVSDPSTPSNIIPYNLVYLKASVVVHMLRFVMGDSTFFQMMHDYITTSPFRFKNIDTEQFKNFCESYHGSDLDWFFNQWVYNSGRMSADYCAFWNETADTLIFKIKGKKGTSSDYHEMPMPVEISTNSGSFYDTLWVDSLNRTERYYFSDSSNLNIQIDPNDKVLKGSFSFLDRPELEKAYFQQNEIHMEWNQFFDFDNYRVFIWREDTPGNYVFYDSVSVGGLNYSFTPSVSGKYSVSVKAISNGHSTQYSNSIQVYFTDFPMDLGLLVIDETRNGTGTHMLMPADSSVDSFYDNLLIGYSYQQFDVYTENRAVNVLDIAHYSTIIWHHDVTYDTKIDDSETALEAFIEAGGKIIISGMNFLNYLSADFHGSFLGYTSYSVNAPADFSGAFGVKNFPDLSNDTTKITTASYQKKLPFVMTFDTSGNSNTLYKYNSVSVNPQFHLKPCGVRTASVIDSTQTAAVILGFPLYFVNPDSARVFMQMALTDLGVTGMPQKSSEKKSTDFRLKNNYPNPFNSKTTIEFSIPGTGFTTLKIFNILGQVVEVLVSQKLSSGNYKYTWDASDFSSGVYFFRLETDQRFVSINKLLLLK